jgi:hypothetical protein
VSIYEVHQTVALTSNGLPAENLVTINEHLEIFLCEDFNAVGIVDESQWRDAF